MRRDLACAALGWALAAAFWIGAARLQRSMLSDEFGAEGLPKGLALVLAGVSTIIAVRAVVAGTKNRGQTPVSEPGAAPAASANRGLAPHLKSLGVVAIGFVYVLLAPWIGFMPAIALLIFTATLYYGAPLRPMVVAMSVVGAVVLWLVFAKMLGISMPSGFWPKLFG